jgi:ABC-type spermidine/putrescine transport system permease subunit I
MKETLETVKGLIGGVTSVLLYAVGLLVVAQVVFGPAAGLNVIGNLESLVTGFVGAGASLASIITLLLVVALFQKTSCCSEGKK